MLPQVPQRLDPLARELLEALRDQPDAGEIVLGGGVALQHYCEYRATRDLDAWWLASANPATEALLERVLGETAARRGMLLSIRRWGETESFELQQSGRTVFGFQIAVRSVTLDPPLPSQWNPVQIETFADNMASKMNAVVARGAPRDLLDVFQVVNQGLTTSDELWRLWHRKNPQQVIEEARASVIRSLTSLERRRPLDSIADRAQRDRAETVRKWIRHSLCRVANA